MLDSSLTPVLGARGHKPIRKKVKEQPPAGSPYLNSKLNN